MTTFNPSDKGGAAVVLSGGNLTASNSSATSLSVRATTSKASGKWVFETTITARAGTTAIGIGFADSGFSVSSYLSSSDLSLAYLDAGNGVLISSSAFGSFASVSNLSVGAIVTCAVDFDSVPGTPRFFFAKNNVWQNSADPTTGAGAFSTSTGNAFFPAVTVTGDGLSSDSVTANFGGTALSYSPPGGYSAWDGAASAFGYPRVIIY